MLPDPPFNITTEQDEKEMTKNILEPLDTEALAKLRGDMIRQRAHAHLPCSVLPPDPWYKCCRRKLRNKWILITQGLVLMVRGRVRLGLYLT